MSIDYYEKLRAAGHVLKIDGHGNVDIFEMDYGIHNGPGCILCHESWCHHCEDEIIPCPNASGALEGETIHVEDLLNGH